ncbi:MAG: proline--tRNA ligase [Planctomycetes bacterium]|jgi:prolyl-tRNA synthetase|nr:proline--tRNA ligase [Planctomycetota bacterium]
MAKQEKNAISPTRSEDYAEWYQQVIKAGDLAETSPVRGCMVIKPWGYAIWENIQRILDGMFKETGHVNAYFPLFIPLSFLQKEAEHVEGFAKECAVVTHHRLKMGPDGKLIPDGPLEEPLVVRPTSETIIGAMFAKWVQSYRDLPLLMNQWANVVRWEMRTRMFLRTTEFLWQEGHTVHADQAEAMEETRRMLDVYAKFAENYMAMPVIRGEKTEGERFPGAVSTFAIEAMMQDRKALQAGTSHFLGQNFAKSSQIKFLDANNQEVYAWTTSWGVSTRLIGGLIMAHSDDDGLVLPPKLSPLHVVIMPVIHDDATKQSVLDYCRKLAGDLKKTQYDGAPIRVDVDARELRGGEKTWGWIKKGVPVRLEVGPRDIASDSVFMGRRDKAPKDRTSMPREAFLAGIPQILDEIQQSLLSRAVEFRRANTVNIDNKQEFYSFFTPQNAQKPEIHGGFAMCHYCPDPAVEEQIRNDLNVTVRCIPIDGDEEPGTCIFTGRPSTKRAVWAKSY